MHDIFDDAQLNDSYIILFMEWKYMLIATKYYE